MGNWVLTIVGSLEEEIDKVVSTVVKAVSDAGHTVQSARVATDAGERDVTPVVPETPVAETPAPEPTPPVEEPPVEAAPTEPQA